MKNKPEKFVVKKIVFFFSFDTKLQQNKISSCFTVLKDKNKIVKERLSHSALNKSDWKWITVMRSDAQFTKRLHADNNKRRLQKRRLWCFSTLKTVRQQTSPQQRLKIHIPWPQAKHPHCPWDFAKHQLPSSQHSLTTRCQRFNRPPWIKPPHWPLWPCKFTHNSGVPAKPTHKEFVRSHLNLNPQEKLLRAENRESLGPSDTGQQKQEASYVIFVFVSFAGRMVSLWVLCPGATTQTWEASYSNQHRHLHRRQIKFVIQQKKPIQSQTFPRMLISAGINVNSWFQRQNGRTTWNL